MSRKRGIYLQRAGNLSALFLYFLPRLLPALEAGGEFVDLVSGFAEQVGGFLAAAAAAAIEGDGAVFLQERVGHLEELGVEDVDIEAAGKVAFGVFGRRADIEALHGGIGNHFGKVVDGEGFEGLCLLLASAQEGEREEEEGKDFLHCFKIKAPSRGRLGGGLGYSYSKV